MRKIERVTGRGVPLPLDDIDTDRIIPARFLRCVTFEGLGEHAFEDDRQQDPQHPFNLPAYAGASILITGRNFGCGSSREHAPQALMRWGVQALVGVSFAEIFFGNCTQNGIPCVTVEPAAMLRLAEFVKLHPEAPITVDLVGKCVRFGDASIPCDLKEGARTALVGGGWDFLGQLVAAEPQVRATARRLPYLTDFAEVGR